ncbi:MAG: hypothetical protein HRT65_14500 [Flavobacteriaceae bacterium]|nr:hypothetical protein [Flavobacteriaceae bacterium]
MKQLKRLPKRIKILIPMIGMVLLWSSCGDKKASNENLQKAFEIHNEALGIQKSALDQMAKLRANKDSLFLDTYSNELNTISSSLEAWNEQLVEVPGFDDHDHSHHDHSDHDHDHDEHQQNGHQELTPEQHLEVQQQLLVEIRAIAEKIEKIKE